MRVHGVSAGEASGIRPPRYDYVPRDHEREEILRTHPPSRAVCSCVFYGYSKLEPISNLEQADAFTVNACLPIADWINWD